jgi:Holliday junction resolvase
MNAKQKGNRFEREVAKMLNQKFNTNVRRTPMSGGMSFKGDIIDINPDSELFRFSFECKNQEKLNIWKALEQAENDAPRMKEPVVIFTKNFKTEYACMKFEDWMNLVKELEDVKKELSKIKNPS